jgi:hypothetical protein
LARRAVEPWRELEGIIRVMTFFRQFSLAIAKNRLYPAFIMAELRLDTNEYPTYLVHFNHNNRKIYPVCVFFGFRGGGIGCGGVKVGGARWRMAGKKCGAKHSGSADRWHACVAHPARLGGTSLSLRRAC